MHSRSILDRRTLRLGVVHAEIIGRAVVHVINEAHYTVGPLLSLLDPMAALTKTAAQIVGGDAEAVIIFGSVARGEADERSDIGLAVIAPPGWEGRVDLEDAVRTRLGNDCDVLVFTAEDFTSLAAAHEPVVDEILVDGTPLIGTMPRVRNGAA